MAFRLLLPLPHIIRLRYTRIPNLDEHPLSRVACQLTLRQHHHHCQLLQAVRNRSVTTGVPTQTDDPRTHLRGITPRPLRMPPSPLHRLTILAMAHSAVTDIPPCPAMPSHLRPRSLCMARPSEQTRYPRGRCPHHPTSPIATNTSHRRTGAIKTNCSTTL